MKRLLLLLASLAAAAQTPTHSEAEAGASARLKALARDVARGDRAALDRFWEHLRKAGTPVVEPIPGDPRNFLVTFLWAGDAATRNVVIFDGVAGFNSKDRMARLADTNVWYKTYKVRSDACFAYSLSPNHPFDPAPEDDRSGDRHIPLFRPDPLNPRRCPATFGPLDAESSWVELPDAPPRPWSGIVRPAASGKVQSAPFRSAILNNERKLWIYTPAGFSTAGERYPLLVIFDGDRNVKWIPAVLDELIAQKRIPPLVAVMVENVSPASRPVELPCNPHFARFLARELVPWMREKHHATADPARTIVAGESFGGLAAVFAGLRYPDAFGNVITLSGSFWWKPANDDGAEWLTRQLATEPKQSLRFYQEIGQMENYEMQVATNRHLRDVLEAKGYRHWYSEYDGGHSYLNWSDGTANALIRLLGR